MICSNMYISFVAKPCSNFRIYYYGRNPNSKSNNYSDIGEQEINDITNLSDLSEDKSLDQLYLEWEDTSPNSTVTNSELSNAIDILLDTYEYGKCFTLNKDIDLAPLIAFAKTYGMLSRPSSKPSNRSTLEGIKHHINSLGIMRCILSPLFPYRKFLPWLYNALNKIKIDLNTGIQHVIYTPYGFIAVEEKDLIKSELYLHIPLSYGFKQNLLEDYHEMKDDKKYIPELFINDLREYALSSMIRYLSSNGLVYSATLDGNKIAFNATVSSPSIYYLLNIRTINSTFNKRLYDFQYTKTTYPKLTSYFRTQYNRKKITQKQYEFAKKKAKELCSESAYRYYEAKKIIQDEIHDYI